MAGCHHPLDLNTKKLKRKCRFADTKPDIYIATIVWNVTSGSTFLVLCRYSFWYYLALQGRRAQQTSAFCLCLIYCYSSLSSIAFVTYSEIVVHLSSSGSTQFSMTPNLNGRSPFFQLLTFSPRRVWYAPVNGSLHTHRSILCDARTRWAFSYSMNFYRV